MTDTLHAIDDRSLNEDVSADTKSTVAPVRHNRRSGLLLTVAVVLMLTAAWKVYRDREFWWLLVYSPLENAVAQQGGAGDSAQRSFDLRGTSIPLEEIHAGGPPKDGIPAISSPKFVTARQATYLQDRDRVVGIASGREAKAYPLRILNYHEVVNDTVGRMPVAVTYCPLCDSTAVFDRRTPLGEREFGVSGLLYNSNVLMYDRKGKPESLWSQIAGSGVSGPARDKTLDLVPFEVTTWQDWRTRFPNTLVLDANTGHRRDYRANPYEAYLGSADLMFPARPQSDRLPAKEAVLGVFVGDQARAYPLRELARLKGPLEESLGGSRFTIEYNAEAKSARVTKADDKVRWMYSFWFAWYAFRPQAELFQVMEQNQRSVRQQP
ncbi:MAG: DUF3179 domain-containing protein [Pirellulales bacterium]